jgi:flagellar motility protein MotE (MotC chaperone)
MTLLGMLMISLVLQQSPDDSDRQNQRREVSEFGAHDRPWAQDMLEIVREDEAQSPAGLCQSSAVITDSLTGEGPSYPAALEHRAADFVAAFETIRAERTAIDEAWDDIADARAVNAVAETRAREELARLGELRDEVAELIDELVAKQDAHMERVAALVSRMSAKDAAELLAKNDDGTILGVLARLDDRESASILSRMETDQGQRLMVRMATQGLPGKDGQEL